MSGVADAVLSAAMMHYYWIENNGFVFCYSCKGNRADAMRAAG